MKKERASKHLRIYPKTYEVHLRIYPKTYEVLRRLAYKRRLSLAAVVAELATKA
jgi:hypothetical protein